MFQSPVRATGALRVVGEPAGRGVAQRAEPGQLVVVVRVVELAAVGHVERPHPDPAAGRADRPRLGGHRVAVPGHRREAVLDVLEADPGDDRDAVPLVVPEGRDLVAERLEAHRRPLVVAGLGLLEGEYVDSLPLHEGLDAVDPGADGVHVPGGEAHASDPTAGRSEGSREYMYMSRRSPPTASQERISPSRR